MTGYLPLSRLVKVQFAFTCASIPRFVMVSTGFGLILTVTAAYPSRLMPELLIRFSWWVNSV